MARVAVIGGGISGLATAYYLSRYARHGRNVLKKIIVIESSKHIGGWVHTSQYPDGAIFEHGPRSFRVAGKSGINTLELAEELGLEDEILALKQGHPAMKNRYIYFDGDRHAVPNSVSSLLLPSPPFNQSLALTALKEVFRKSEKGLEDDSIHSFVSRRLGSKVADFGADPIVRGIFAGDIRELSMKAIFPEVFKYEQEHGSVVVGGLKQSKEKTVSNSRLIKKVMEEKWGIWSLRKGLQQLVDAMVAKLREHPEIEVVVGSPCTGINFRDDKKVKVKTEQKEYSVDHVCSTVFAPHNGDILPVSHSKLRKILNKIEGRSVGVVNLEYSGKILNAPGFGHLVPSKEPTKNLGVVYDSHVFPEHDRKDRASERFTVMLGGSWFNEHFGPPEHAKKSEIIDAAIFSMQQQLKVEKEPERVLVNIQKDCIPQYKVGHTNLLHDLWVYTREHKLPLSLLGSSYKGVSVNDCIYNAKLEVERIFPDLCNVQG